MNKREFGDTIVVGLDSNDRAFTERHRDLDTSCVAARIVL
jgi:hypothetical protein